MNKLIEYELGYHAAMIDGEGCISASRQKQAANVIPKISVSNTNLTMLEYLKITSGIGTIDPFYDSRGNRKKNWSWRIEVKDMRDYLIQIESKLIIKRQQAILILELLDTYNNYNRKNRVPENIHIIRQVIHDELSELNRRGK